MASIISFTVFHLTLEVDVIPQLNVVCRKTPPVLDLRNGGVCKQIFVIVIVIVCAIVIAIIIVMLRQYLILAIGVSANSYFILFKT